MSVATPAWLSLDDARERALAATPVLTGTETVLLAEALNRITACAIQAPVNVPPWDNSAMDGYALRAEDADLNTCIPVSMTVFAGDSQIQELARGTAARIMTGAPLPAGADTVVMQENVQRNGDDIVITEPPRQFANIRRKGNDITHGDTVISAGTRLNAAHLMLLASQGLDTVTVYRPLRVGLMVTGDELQTPGTPLQPGHIYESNRTGLKALLAPLAVSVTDYGIVPDDKAALINVMRRACGEVDMLISSGGVSVGDADYVKEVLESLGDVNFWKVAVKPGKPFAFGMMDNTCFCGVPGNPVSAYVTTQLLVRPVIERYQGLAAPTQPLALSATLTTAVQRRAGRTEFQRAVMHPTQGGWQVTPLPRQSSGVMSSVTQANCYLVVPAEVSTLDAGSPATVLPFDTRLTPEGVL
ncbi:molybdopterin molybdotransferase MoeA [Alteromonas sp. ASW11-19]|uniref:Molybdopterin molybdenumtransferase n=1 Tax=Alteromonas salexigens TaxID=2982530 RepID=A0ABT2VLT7_9ALTE|nr:gephyrin-like molybdotransferase Glp [Alteromonas salexigens]MCU7554040.1 molybdopterin molybdotransferase MoeA [Alteromonas salexigens]